MNRNVHWQPVLSEEVLQVFMQLTKMYEDLRKVADDPILDRFAGDPKGDEVTPKKRMIERTVSEAQDAIETVQNLLLEVADIYRDPEG